MNLSEIIELTSEDVVKTIEEQFQPLKVQDICRIANGLDNTVYKVNGRYVFRFPRRDIADALMIKEGAVLPIIQQSVTLPVPHPVFYGNPTREYPFHFLGFEYMQGFGVDEIAAINPVDSTPILAGFLSQLHSVPVQKVEGIVGHDEIGRLNVAKRKGFLLENTQAIKKMGITDTARLESYGKEVTDIKLREEPVLVHGDLHIRNLLYQRNGVVSSVIDFGDIHVGHRACDLAIVYSILPREQRGAFYQSYGEVSQETEEAARFRAIFTNTILLLSASQSDNAALMERVIVSLNNALS